MSTLIVFIQVGPRCSTLTFEPFFGATLRKQIPCYVFCCPASASVSPYKKQPGVGFLSELRRPFQRVAVESSVEGFEEKWNFVAVNAQDYTVYSAEFIHHLQKDYFYFTKPEAVKTRLIIIFFFLFGFKTCSWPR